MTSKSVYEVCMRLTATAWAIKRSPDNVVPMPTIGEAMRAINGNRDPDVIAKELLCQVLHI